MRTSALVLVLTLAFLACLARPGAGVMQLYMLPGTRCLDGTPYGFYFEQGRRDKFAFYFLGGGACYSLEMCLARLNTTLGSSSDWTHTMSPPAGTVLDGDPRYNVAFFDWTKVFLPYCTGDVHSGQLDTPNEWGMYFAGHVNVMAALQQLVAQHGLGEASAAIVSGGSAGGIGAFYYVDTVASLAPKADVRGAPVGGYFFPNVSMYSEWLVDPTAGLPDSYFETLATLWDMWHHPGCAAAMPANQSFLCGDVSMLFPFIQSELYIAENWFDSNQIFVELGAPLSSVADPFIVYYGQRMRASMQQVLDSPSTGLFLPSCLSHVLDLIQAPDMPTIHGVSYAESFMAWALRSHLAPYKLVDPCVSSPLGMPCGNHCTNLTLAMSP